MTADTTFKEQTRTMMRARLLEAAHDLTIAEGWRNITMSDIAAEVGVSRQTVYNEFGNKAQLAEALVLRELERFLTVVGERIEAASDVVEAVRSAVEGALSFAEENPLVKVALSPLPSGNELLPYLTTDSQRIIETAKLVIVEALDRRDFELPLPEADIARAIEMIVRLVLSSLTRPSKEPTEMADDIAWMFRLALTGAGVPSS